MDTDPVRHEDHGAALCHLGRPVAHVGDLALESPGEHHDQRPGARLPRRVHVEQRRSSAFLAAMKRTSLKTWISCVVGVVVASLRRSSRSANWLPSRSSRRRRRGRQPRRDEQRERGGGACAGASWRLHDVSFLFCSCGAGWLACVTAVRRPFHWPVAFSGRQSGQIACSMLGTRESPEPSALTM